MACLNGSGGIDPTDEQGQAYFFYVLCVAAAPVDDDARDSPDFSGQRSSIEFFREELEKFVRSNEDICVFEPWMLEE